MVLVWSWHGKEGEQATDCANSGTIVACAIKRTDCACRPDWHRV